MESDKELILLLKKGDESDFVIIEFNKEFKRVVASHTHVFKAKEAKSSTAKKNQAKSEKAKLGDIKELANLKEKLDDKD